MLGAHALRAKQEAERREREKKDRAKELQKAAKRLGEAAQLVFTEKAGSSSARGSRAHSIYDFAILSARSVTEQGKNGKIKSRFSLNVGSSPLLITRELTPKRGRNASSGSIHSLLLLTPRSLAGPFHSPDYRRNRSGSSQSARSAPASSTKSAISSAGSKLLRWLGISSKNNEKETENSRKSKEKKYKRRMSAF
ncbi:hypothetical protein ACQ4LE_007250 [Meloidogyne hapla]|uniref:Uncharacterized protein n=1 Tax=Meloidogyne hapla TaxID=6305 RepID=A0A1I8B8T2_MELHA